MAAAATFLLTQLVATLIEELPRLFMGCEVMHVDEFIAIADQHLPGRACPQKETCRDASSSPVLTYAAIQKHHGGFSQEKFSPRRWNGKCRISNGL